jgi:hypothetical protein
MPAQNQAQVVYSWKKRGYGLNRRRLNGHQGQQITAGWAILAYAYDADTLAIRDAEKQDQLLRQEHTQRNRPAASWRRGRFLTQELFRGKQLAAGLWLPHRGPASHRGDTTRCAC